MFRPRSVSIDCHVSGLLNRRSNRVIREIQLFNFHSRDPLYCLLRLAHTNLHRLLGWIALGQDICQPGRCNPAPTQAFLQSVAMQMVVYDARQSQPLHDFHQKRKIIDPFHCYVHLRAHPLSLSNYSRFIQIFQRMIRYQDEENMKWREPGNRPPEDQSIDSPYDPEARYSEKRGNG